MIIVYLAFGALRGWGRGLVAMAAGLAAFLAALVVARIGYAPLARFLNLHFGLARGVQTALGRIVPQGTLALPGISQQLNLTTDAVVGALAFLAILLVVEGVLGIAVAVIGRLPNRLPLIGPLNRLLGAAFGALEAVAITAAVLLLLEPLARAGALGSLSPYIARAPLAQSLWHLGGQVAPLLRRLP